MEQGHISQIINVRFTNAHFAWTSASERPVNARRMPGECPENVRRTSGDCPKIARRTAGECSENARSCKIDNLTKSKLKAAKVHALPTESLGKEIQTIRFANTQT